MKTLVPGFDSVALPGLTLIRQTFDSSRIQDLAPAVRQELEKSGVAAKVKPGQSVAITGGSRGIHGLDTILRETCAFFSGLGAEPFIFPAMGSHGGATDQGQAEVLATLGVDQERMGAPILSSMETVVLGETRDGTPVHCDRNAARADHVVLVNRVKAHTKFKGPLESGLFKMMAVGMGKHAGAALVHRHSIRLGFPRLIETMGHAVLEHLPILCGLGIVENGFGQTHTIRALEPGSMEDGEKELLLLAKELSPKIPFPDIDLLIVDEIGKDISGTGMDTNVTGRNRDILGDFTSEPRVRRILVRDLSAKTKGNALGIGFADFTTDRLVAAMEYEKTVTNALTGVSPEKAAIPIHFPSDREALVAALNSLGNWSPDTVQVVRIKNTRDLEQLYISPGLLTALPRGCRILETARPPRFGADNNLLDPL